MRVIKKTIGFAVKLSKNYNVVECSESVELEFNKEEKVDYVAIDVISTELRSRVMKEAKAKIEEVVSKNPPQQVKGTEEEVELVM